MTATSDSFTPSKAGGALVGVGVLAIVGAYVWDFYHGVRIIEEKRDKARYKIGKIMNGQAHNSAGSNAAPLIKVTPMVSPQRSAAGLQLQMQF